MKTKHTPGPWMVYVPERGQDGHPHNLSIGAETETRATYVASVPGGAHYDWAQANARLIAAAPDLLAALKDALKDLSALSHWDTASACAMKARAAIEKAEGDA